jgi:hypothetical protein
MRYPVLYHSFPRRTGAQADEKGLAILRSILERGLLITPEIVPWTMPDGTPFRISHKRICFTAVDPDQLSEHAKLFGELSVGFKRSDLEGSGAIPVFYVPRSNSARNRRGNIGGFHVGRLYELLEVIRQVKRTDQTFTLKGKPISLTDLEAFTAILSTQYYPIEDIEDQKERHYFAQREWRIPGNLFFEGTALDRKLTEHEAASITSIDPEFFLKEQEFPTGVYPLIQQTKLIATIGDTPVREAVVHVVTPARLETRVRQLLEEARVTPDVSVL